MTRIDRDQLGLLLAATWAMRGTCARRRVGCVLWDAAGNEVSTGYNGPPHGAAHCIETPCPAASAPSGTQLSACEAIHAEANALLRCSDITHIHTCYVTASPCIDCVKLLQNTGCRRIVFAERYAHDAEAQERWTRGSAVSAPDLLRNPPRTWEHIVPTFAISERC